jgi:acetylornithine deacetylase
MSTTPIGTAPLLSLHKSLVEISSISGNERNVSDFLKGYLQDHGFTVESQPVVGDRENILAYLGKSRQTRVLVTSHIDTVPPFLPYERKGDEIWGRGTVDAKGSVASQIIAAESLIHEGKIKEGDIALLFVVGEEKTGAGMIAANDLGLSWESVIFGEPTDLKLVSGHKGGIGFTLRAKGKAGHSGYPEQGKNAIDLLIPGLVALQTLELPSSKKFGETTLNIGRIEGGVASNVIPENASATVLIRIAAGGPTEIQELVRDAVSKAAPELEMDFAGGRGPVPIEHDIPGKT